MIYLAAVLVLLWLLVGGYLVFMLKRQQALEKDLHRLQQQLEEKNMRDGSNSS